MQEGTVTVTLLLSPKNTLYAGSTLSRFVKSSSLHTPKTLTSFQLLRDTASVLTWIPRQ